MNGLTIEGELANHGDAPASARITARFIGSSGAVSGSVSGIVPDVQAGLIKVYQLVMDKTVADIARVQMHLDAAFAGQLIPKFPIDGVAVQRTDAGPVVVGQLTNPETKDHAMTLIAGFWDARSELIGVATCPTIKVGAGETGLFQLRTTDDVGNYRQVVVQVDALVK